jgi:hypothetical protein
VEDILNRHNSKYYPKKYGSLHSIMGDAAHKNSNIINIGIVGDFFNADNDYYRRGLKDNPNLAGLHNHNDADIIPPKKRGDKSTIIID